MVGWSRCSQRGWAGSTWGSAPRWLVPAAASLTNQNVCIPRGWVADACNVAMTQSLSAARLQRGFPHLGGASSEKLAPIAVVVLILVSGHFISYSRTQSLLSGLHPPYTAKSYWHPSFAFTQLSDGHVAILMWKNVGSHCMLNTRHPLREWVFGLK
jgi:hypothetical protein